MKAKDLVVYAVIAAVVLATAAVLAVAQTAPGDEAAGVQMAQARGPGGPPGGARPGGQGRPDYAQIMRDRLTAAGATEADIQAIEAHRTKQREIMRPLGEALGALGEASSAEATDAQAKNAVAAVEAAKKTALAALAKAEDDLKAKLNLATKPKLHAALLSMGTLDNGMRGGRGGRTGGQRGGGTRGGGGRPAGGAGRGA